ncbi:hypothetical protein [Thalassovita sp.]|uniref:hypothetical protein n=1 Tax=Thalassovita sp. TaxID=1979401 RepID=UPI0029DE76D2|nr:hypothetical protein [Thalassovita sp.]
MQAGGRLLGDDTLISIHGDKLVKGSDGTYENVGPASAQEIIDSEVVVEPRPQVYDGPDFVTDTDGNTVDLSFAADLREIKVEVRGARGGVQYPLQDQIPNSYANLGNGHAVVYGPSGRALYDVSNTRIKAIELNQTPSGRWFPKRNSSQKRLLTMCRKLF